MVNRRIDFIHEGAGIIPAGNQAEAVRIDDQVVFADPVRGAGTMSAAGEK